MSGGLLLIVVLTLVSGLVMVMRRPSVGPALRWPARGRITLLLAAACAVSALLAANRLESSLHGWDTATPWDRHEVLTWLGLLGAGLAPAGLFLLTRAADAARRRVGVAVQAPSARDALVGGAILTLVPRVTELLPSLLLTFPPSASDTVLDTAVPWAALLGSALMGGVSRTAFVTLLAASAMAVTRPRVRAFGLVVVALAAAAATSSSAATSLVDWAVRGLVQFLAIGGSIAVLWRWGRQSFEAWLVGGLLMAMLDALAAVPTAATAADAAAHVTSVIPAVVALVWLLRRPREVVGVTVA